MGKPVKVCPVCNRIYFVKYWVKATDDYYKLLTRDGIKYQLCTSCKLIRVRVKALAKKLS